MILEQNGSMDHPQMILWQNLEQVLDTGFSPWLTQLFYSVLNHCFDHQHLPLRSRMASVLFAYALVCQPAWDMIYMLSSSL